MKRESFLKISNVVLSLILLLSCSAMGRSEETLDQKRERVFRSLEERARETRAEEDKYSSLPVLMDAVRKKKEIKGRRQKLSPEKMDQIFPYLTDTDQNVRGTAFDMLEDAALSTSNTVVRQMAVERLVTSLLDPSFPTNRKSQLQGFRASDFSEKARRDLVTWLNDHRVSNETLHDPRLLKMVISCAGTADEISAIPILKEFYQNDSDVFQNLEKVYAKENPYRRPIENPWENSVGWASALALARMGDGEMNTLCIWLVDSFPDKNQHRSLYGSLYYIRSSQAVEYLKGKMLDQTPVLQYYVDGPSGSYETQCPLGDYAFNTLKGMLNMAERDKLETLSLLDAKETLSKKTTDELMAVIKK